MLSFRLNYKTFFFACSILLASCIQPVTKVNFPKPAGILNPNANSGGNSGNSGGALAPFQTVLHTLPYGRCLQNDYDKLFCWGREVDKLSPYETSSPKTAVSVIDTINVKKLDSGYLCFIGSDDLIYCWGGNSTGRLGINSIVNSPIPVAAQRTGALVGKTFKRLSSTAYNTCAVSSDNLPYCWGGNSYGTNGDGTNTNRLVPTPVDMSGVLSGKTIKEIYLTGPYGACALASDDLVYCWGSGTVGELGNGAILNSNVPVAVTTSGVLSGKTVKSLHVNSKNSCVIASDDKVYCWGRGVSGVLGNGTDSVVTSSPVAVDMTGVLSGKTIKKLSISDVHSCAIASDDLLYCWGLNGWGELGDNSTTLSSVPVAVNMAGALNGKTIKDVKAINYATCAIASDDKIYCWGRGSFGLPGSGLNTNVLVPAAVDTSGVLGSKTIKKFAEGNSNTICVIASDDLPYCWAGNSDGKLGSNSTAFAELSPVAVDMTGALFGKTVKNIVTYSSTTCFHASDEKVYCAGYNSTGDLGNGKSFASATPQKLYNHSSSNQTMVDIQKTFLNKSGETCFLRANNELYCGLPEYGYVYKFSFGSHTITEFFTSDSWSTYCALTDLGKALCWGAGTNGELGNNAILNSDSPVQVDDSGVLSGKKILKLSIGTGKVCALADDKKVYCWGSGGSGALGNGANVQSSVPVAVTSNGTLNGLDVEDLQTYQSTSCVLASDKEMYCWGSNSYGILGDGSVLFKNTPTAVSTAGVLSGLTINKFNINYDSICAIASNKKVYCWGYGIQGKLGDGSNSHRDLPVAVDDSGVLNLKLIKDISLGSAFTCALSTTNEIFCWGFGISGQLGNGANLTSFVPVAVDMSGVLSGKTIKQFSAGNTSMCVTDTDDKVYCWGAGLSGQLGQGNVSNSNLPIEVVY